MKTLWKQLVIGGNHNNHFLQFQFWAFYFVVAVWLSTRSSNVSIRQMKRRRVEKKQKHSHTQFTHNFFAYELIPIESKCRFDSNVDYLFALCSIFVWSFIFLFIFVAVVFVGNWCSILRNYCSFDVLKVLFDS